MFEMIKKILGVSENLTDPKQYDIKKDKYEKAALKQAMLFMDDAKVLMDKLKEDKDKEVRRSIKNMIEHQSKFNEYVIKG